MSKRLFSLGQPVICINDDFKWCRRNYPEVQNYPRFASRYIIRGYVTDGSHPAVVLRELTNINVLYLNGQTHEAGFWQDRFVAASPPIIINGKVKREEMA